MVTQVQKWGNSLALRIPKVYADEIKIKQNTPIEFSIVNGSLVIRPVRKPKYTLEELLAGITDENIHDPISTGAPVGREAL